METGRCHGDKDPKGDTTGIASSGQAETTFEPPRREVREEILKSVHGNNVMGSMPSL
jgi:hypothetical protein